MSDGTFLNIKRPITVRAVVTPTWKEEAERELSNGIATADQQLAQLEQEGQDVVDQVRRQSANPLDPRVQDQVGQIQQQVAAKARRARRAKAQPVATAGSGPRTGDGSDRRTGSVGEHL